jgi:hypothetical protein
VWRTGLESSPYDTRTSKYPAGLRSLTAFPGLSPARSAAKTWLITSVRFSLRRRIRARQPCKGFRALSSRTLCFPGQRRVERVPAIAV